MNPLTLRKIKGIILKSREEISQMRKACAIAMEILLKVAEKVSPGISALEIDSMARSLCKEYKVKPAFLGYGGFPGAICVSVNEEVVHGIPTKSKEIKEGDIVSLDFGVICDGWYGDVAITVGVGNISETARKLIETTEKALYVGIDSAKVGGKLIDISRSIQKFVGANGFNVVRGYAGHGI